MTQKDVLEIALKQSAADCSCSPADFTRTDHVITEAVPGRAEGPAEPAPLPHDLLRVQHRGGLPEGPDPGDHGLCKQPAGILPLL